MLRSEATGGADEKMPVAPERQAKSVIKHAFAPKRQAALSKKVRSLAGKYQELLCL